MIDFELSPQQEAIRGAVRSFAKTHLKKARSLYDPPTPHAKWEDRFRSTQPIYRAAVEAGLIKAQIPTQLGGTSGALIDAALVVEEMYAVETSTSLTILGTGLGLTPLIVRLFQTWISLLWTFRDKFRSQSLAVSPTYTILSSDETLDGWHTRTSQEVFGTFPFRRGNTSGEPSFLRTYGKVSPLLSPDRYSRCPIQ